MAMRVQATSVPTLDERMRRARELVLAGLPGSVAAARCMLSAGQIAAVCEDAAQAIAEECAAPRQVKIVDRTWRAWPESAQATVDRAVAEAWPQLPDIEQLAAHLGRGFTAVYDRVLKARSKRRAIFKTDLANGVRRVSSHEVVPRQSGTLGARALTSPALIGTGNGEDRRSVADEARVTRGRPTPYTRQGQSRREVREPEGQGSNGGDGAGASPARNSVQGGAEVARQAHNLEVGRSNRPPATNRVAASEAQYATDGAVSAFGGPTIESLRGSKIAPVANPARSDSGAPTTDGAPDEFQGASDESAAPDLPAASSIASRSNPAESGVRCAPKLGAMPSAVSHTAPAGSLGKTPAGDFSENEA